MRLRITYSLENFFMRWWWVLLFIILCYLFYEQGLKTRDQKYALLYRKLMELRGEKQIAKSTQEDLLLQINSQSDPAWVELTLMKGLGLVPEGQTKVFFTQYD